MILFFLSRTYLSRMYKINFIYCTLNLRAQNSFWKYFYTDFSKAFDRVRHCLLLDKMSGDIEPARCQWLPSYFYSRIQRYALEWKTVFREIIWLLLVFYRAAFGATLLHLVCDFLLQFAKTKKWRKISLKYAMKFIVRFEFESFHAIFC
jgi:hypothetical protein